MLAVERGRRPPQVIQTSNLDCGPAALASLLRGLGCPASYEVLRDVCATDVDGTSINAVEQVARAAGAAVEQLVVPAEHVTALPKEYLPAVAVTVLPDGFTHFVVLWRRVRDRVLVMDPGVGCRWVRAADLHAELYRHDQPVPAAAWRQWAGSDVFLAGLTARLTALGVDEPLRPQLLAAAVADPEVAGLAGLDAAIRTRETSTPRRPRPSLFDAAAALAGRWASGGDAYSCAPVHDAAGTLVEGGVTLRGAVLVRATGWSAEAAQPGLAARLAVPEPGPGALLLSLLPHPRRLLATLVASALLVAGLSLAADVTLRSLITPSADRVRVWPVLAVLAAAAAALAVSAAGSLRTGRRAEVAIRARWWSAVAQLPDRFVSTRPVSDLAERGHLLHRVRELSVTALRAAASLGVVLGGVAVVAVLAPRTWPWLAVLALVAIAGPTVAARRTTETDLRLRTLSGGLSRFGYDAVLGAEAVQACGAGPALSGEHERSLTAWWAVQMRLIVLTSTTRAAVGVLAAASGAGVLATAHVGAAQELLIAVLVVTVADAGGQLSDGLRTIPVSRSIVARAAGPLRAATADGPQQVPAGPVSIECRAVTVSTGTTVQLQDVTLDVAAGTHVAVIGGSGSGKSSLLAVLLGWSSPSSGQVLLGGAALVPGQAVSGVAWSAPETRLWNDTVTANVDYGADPSAAAVEQRLRTAGAVSLAMAVNARDADRVTAPDGGNGSGSRQRLAGAGSAGSASGGAAIGDGGALLSDGETQRIRFARALGRPGAGLVVLDEPFRGMERDSRQQLMRAARYRWRHATLVAAVHDVADTRDFDLIVVLDAGRVVEVGVPATLAADAGSRYASLLAADQAQPYVGWTPLTLGQRG